MILIADCETDGFDYTKMHCLSCKPYGTSEAVRRFTDMGKLEEYVDEVKPTKWVFHNGLGFDLYALNELTGIEVAHTDIIDTQVVSKLVNYAKFRTHSLKELGGYLGVYKGDYTGGWDTYTEEMGEYCDQDVLVLEAIFKHYYKYIVDPKWAKSLRVEHEMAHICHNMKKVGFGFDKEGAADLLLNINKEKSELEDSFKAAFGKKLVEAKRIKYRTKEDGTLYSNVIKALGDYPKTLIEGDELVCYEHKEFNPASPKDRIDALWDAGWKPHEKTLGHIKATKKRRMSR